MISSAAPKLLPLAECMVVKLQIVIEAVTRLAIPLPAEFESGDLRQCLPGSGGGGSGSGVSGAAPRGARARGGPMGASPPPTGASAPVSASEPVVRALASRSSSAWTRGLEV